jgi:hypothetical protein
VNILALTFCLMFQHPNLEQQARVSLDKAEKTLIEARQAYAKQELDLAKALIKELQADVEAAAAALTETGKDARRRPKQFKYGEVKTRDLLRHLSSFENEMELDDRPLLVPARNSIQEVHDAWLLGIMGDKTGTNK